MVLTGNLDLERITSSILKTTYKPICPSELLEKTRSCAAEMNEQ